jgi:hypothetical protein
MPPQQPGGPLDVVDDALNLRAHAGDLPIRPRRRNRHAQGMNDMRERLIRTWKLVSVSREETQVATAISSVPSAAGEPTGRRQTELAPHGVAKADRLIWASSSIAAHERKWLSLRS